MINSCNWHEGIVLLDNQQPSSYSILQTGGGSKDTTFLPGCQRGSLTICTPARDSRRWPPGKEWRWPTDSRRWPVSCCPLDASIRCPAPAGWPIRAALGAPDVGAAAAPADTGAGGDMAGCCCAGAAAAGDAALCSFTGAATCACAASHVNHLLTVVFHIKVPIELTSPTAI